MEKNNTQKGIVQFAMEAGAYMGLYFVVKFIFAVLSLNYPFCNVVSTIMLLFVPLVVFFMMRKFSNQNEGGSYFSQLWMMGILPLSTTAKPTRRTGRLRWQTPASKP